MVSIDVVVPCYRYGRYLRECVRSVLSQGIAQCRVLIIDDHSPDETPMVARALAEEDARVTVRRHAANEGHIRTYNEGIAWCEAECMLLLSADDHLLPGALARALAVMTQHPEVGLCFGEAVETSPDGIRRHVGLPIDFQGRPVALLRGADFVRHCASERASNIVPTPTAIVRTRLLERHGAYRDDLPHSADLELWLRLAAHGDVAAIHAEQAVYRRHAGNMSSAYYADHHLADLRQREAAFDIFLAGCATAMPEAAELHRMLRRMLGTVALDKANLAFNDGQLALSSSLGALAASLHPAIERSAAWRTLAAKRLIGVAATNALRSLRERARWRGPRRAPDAPRAK